MIAIRSLAEMHCRMLVFTLVMDGPILAQSVSNCPISIRRKLCTLRPLSLFSASSVSKVSYAPYWGRRSSHGAAHVFRRRRDLCSLTPLRLAATTAKATTMSSSESIAVASLRHGNVCSCSVATSLHPVRRHIRLS